MGLIDSFFTAFMNKRNEGGTFWYLAGLERINHKKLLHKRDEGKLSNFDPPPPSHATDRTEKFSPNDGVNIMLRIIQL